MRNAEAVFWCVRDCSNLETLAIVAAEYCSSMVEESIGAFLKTRIDSWSYLLRAIPTPYAECVDCLAVCTVHPSMGWLYKRGLRVTELL